LDSKNSPSSLARSADAQITDTVAKRMPNIAAIVSNAEACRKTSRRRQASGSPYGNHPLK
jgi:hypothetical protein